MLKEAWGVAEELLTSMVSTQPAAAPGTVIV
jgi:hypothetical protein